VMPEFESTLQGHAPASHTTAVYDPRDGRIVYTHEFIGDESGLCGPGGRSERERIALEAVQNYFKDADRLRVLDLPEGFRFDHDKLYVVDLKTGALTIRADLSARVQQAQRSNHSTDG
jgi:hypothetical protein